MSGSSRRGSRGTEFPSTDSVLSELWNTGAPEADTSSTDDVPVSNTPPPPGGEESAESKTPVHDATDTRTSSGGNRTPEGMTRHTLYIARETAELLDAAAARLQSDLGGLVPKHRILAALITAGVDQADAVRAGLRAELLDNLNA